MLLLWNDSTFFFNMQYLYIFWVQEYIRTACETNAFILVLTCVKIFCILYLTSKYVRWAKCVVVTTQLWCCYSFVVELKCRTQIFILGFFSPLSPLCSTCLGLLWYLLCASTTWPAGLSFNVYILREEDRTKSESKFSLLHSHLCSYSCMVTSKLLVSPWYTPVPMKTIYLFSFGNLLAMQANTIRCLQCKVWKILISQI